MKNNGQKYVPFGYKLMLSYCIFTLIPVLLVGYTANSIFVKSMREQTKSINQGTLRQMKDNITYKMDDVNRLSKMLYFDNVLIEYLRHYEEGWVSYEATTKYLLPRLQSTIESINDRVGLSVYLHNHTLPEVYHRYEGDPLATTIPQYDLYHISRIADKPWYLEYPPERYGQTVVWKQIEDDVKYQHISFLRRIVDTENPLNLHEVGFIRISVRLADLFESVDFNKIGTGAMIYLVDENGRIIISSGMTGQNAGERLDLESSGKYMMIQESLPTANWRLISLIPANIAEQDTKESRFWTMLICLACFILFFFVSMFISRYFGRRVSKIISVLDSFHEGDFNKQVYFKGRDEFTRISLALNEMGQNIGKLIEEVYLTNMQKKEAELESLQAQINPHFLYNTLSSISRLAKFGQIDKLQRMVLDLAKFYRLSLNEGRTVIPIKNEIEQAEAYINIQKTKFGDGMDVRMDIDPSILRYKTIKLILQPFIENALEHAWFGDKIHIRVVGTLLDNAVEFKIIDDGIGMHPDLIRQIFDPVEGLNVGYGIRNVDQRIRLHFGNDYGISIASRPGIGATVRILIPLQT